MKIQTLRRMAAEPRCEAQEGEWVRCQHCEGMGIVQGPGGREPCCHCCGRGERWVDSCEDADLDRS